MSNKNRLLILNNAGSSSDIKLEVITSSHHGHKRKKNEEESIPYEEGKGKDHDGDGDIDSDDYMAAKDKAIKKAMGKDKEANEQFKPKKLKKITVGGKTYEKEELDPNDDGRILRIEKYPNGYFITGSTGREGYGYAIDLKGNEIDEDDLEYWPDDDDEYDDVFYEYDNDGNTHYYYDEDDEKGHGNYKYYAYKKDSVVQPI